MNKKKTFYTICGLLLILLLTGFLSVQAVELAEGSQYLKMVSLCKDVEEKEPVLETTSFSVWDERAICWIRFNYSSHEAFDITWEWEDPKGNTYHTGNLEMEPGDYQNYRSWYGIGIQGHYAANLPGEWIVRVYLNDFVVAIKNFTIS